MKSNKIFSNQRRKKAQMKIQEMAFVLVAVVFLGTLLLLFFARFQMTKIKEQAIEIRQQRTISLLRVISSIPELSCKDEINCIDLDKLKAFSSTTLQEKYKPLWGSSNIVKIVVKEVYPKESRQQNVEHVIYNKQSNENTVTYATFIPLCYESLDGQFCKLAIIKITTIIP